MLLFVVYNKVEDYNTLYYRVSGYLFSCNLYCLSLIKKKNTKNCEKKTKNKAKLELNSGLNSI